MTLNDIIPGVECPLVLDEDISASELRDLVTEEALTEILRTIMDDDMIRSTLSADEIKHVIDETFHCTELRSATWKLVDAELAANDY